MGLFNLTKKKRSFESFDIPKDILELLWFDKNKANQITVSKNIFSDSHIKLSGLSQEEPSLIDRKLKIVKCESVDNLDYFPRFKELSPCQRYKYLSWLEDISKPIDIGYVFLFYYGLERYLLTDKFEKAIKMIDRLRKFHDIGSYKSYSSDAIIMSCYINERMDLFEVLKEPLKNTELYYFVKIMRTNYLSYEDIFNASYILNFKNKRYIKGYPKLFKEELKKVFEKRYNDEFIYISESEILKSPKINISVFANVSLRNELYQIYDCFSNPQISDNLMSVMQEAHDRVKNRLKEIRKKGIKPEPKKTNVNKKSYIVGNAEFKQKEKHVVKQLRGSKTSIDKHFAYMAASDFYYKYREDKEMLAKSKEFAQKDVNLFPQLYNDLIKEFGVVPRLPSFDRLAMIYEKEGDISSALEISKLGRKYTNNSQSEKLRKRIMKYENKMSQA